MELQVTVNQQPSKSTNPSGDEASQNKLMAPSRVSMSNVGRKPIIRSKPPFIAIVLMFLISVLFISVILGFLLRAENIRAEDRKEREEMKLQINMTEARLTQHIKNSGKQTSESSGNKANDALVNDDGWLVIQRRCTGKLSFDRTWASYQKGFEYKEELWLGLDKLHNLTKSVSYKLRVELEDWNGEASYAEYNVLAIGNATSNYRLTVSGYSGTAGDSLVCHNNQPFSTQERDNDSNNEENCAEKYHGGWWYKKCYEANLNGEYCSRSCDKSSDRWMTWLSRRGFMPLKKTEMKIKLN